MITTCIRTWIVSRRSDEKVRARQNAQLSFWYRSNVFENFSRAVSRGISSRFRVKTTLDLVVFAFKFCFHVQIKTRRDYHKRKNEKDSGRGCKMTSSYIKGFFKDTPADTQYSLWTKKKPKKTILTCTYIIINGFWEIFPKLHCRKHLQPNLFKSKSVTFVQIL